MVHLAKHIEIRQDSEVLYKTWEDDVGKSEESSFSSRAGGSRELRRRKNSFSSGSPEKSKSSSSKGSSVSRTGSGSSVSSLGSDEVKYNRTGPSDKGKEKENTPHHRHIRKPSQGSKRRASIDSTSTTETLYRIVAILAR